MLQLLISKNHNSRKITEKKMCFVKKIMFSFSQIPMFQTICTYAHAQSSKNFIMIDSRIYEIRKIPFLLHVDYFTARVVKKEGIIEVLQVEMVMKFHSYNDVQIVYT